MKIKIKVVVYFVCRKITQTFESWTVSVHRFMGGSLKLKKLKLILGRCDFKVGINRSIGSLTEDISDYENVQKFRDDS